MTDSKQIIEKTAWPLHPIETYHNEEGDWGYLIVYSDNTVQFLDAERPTSDEIKKRWNHYFRLNR